MTAPKPSVAVSSMAAYQRGRDLESNGDNQNAQAKYLEALRAADVELSQNPKKIDSYVVKAWCQLRLKRYADVISTGAVALRISDDMRMVEVMGESYFYLNQMDDCLRYLQLYVNNVPETAERLATAYFFMGEVYSIRKQWEHADISYTLSVYYAPSMARWWFRLGGAKEAKSDLKGALQAYEKSVALLPSATAFVEARNRVKAQVGQ
jgi:tetratricopeptide (TPR) repeat protein